MYTYKYLHTTIYVYIHILTISYLIIKIIFLREHISKIMPPPPRVHTHTYTHTHTHTHAQTHIHKHKHTLAVRITTRNGSNPNTAPPSSPASLPPAIPSTRCKSSKSGVSLRMELFKKRDIRSARRSMCGPPPPTLANWCRVKSKEAKSKLLGEELWSTSRAEATSSCMYCYVYTGTRSNYIYAGTCYS